MKVAVGLHRYAIENWPEVTSLALESERLGVDSLWSAEAWAHDG
ncbi:MAG: F420-dependent methylene-tetrahydromethanopterin reductase, partial [Chloroflexi bacterium]|nr:F420-dependent methylene-tetrahydromethanopterin reductase [Chloroflexota bacterium]